MIDTCYHPCEVMMTSWYARNSLMPSTGHRKASNQITELHNKKCIVDTNQQDGMKKCIVREQQRSYSFEQDVHTTRCEGLLDNQIEVNDFVPSQISDISMSQSNGNSHRVKNNQERSASKEGALLLCQEKETASLSMRSSTQTTDNSGASISYSVCSVPTLSSGGSISAFSNGLFRSSALSWQPAKFRNQHLPFSHMPTHLPIPNITDKSTCSQSQFMTSEWNRSCDRSYPERANRSPHGSISDIKYVAQKQFNENERTSFVNINSERKSVNSVYVNNTPSSDITSVSHCSKSYDKSNDFARNSYCNDIFSNSSMNKFKLARSTFRTDSEFHSSGKDASIKQHVHATSPDSSDVRDRVGGILQKIEVKGSSLTKQLVEMENREHKMHLRLAAAEEAQTQKAEELQEQYKLILNEIDRFKIDIHSTKQRSEKELNCITSEIIKKLKESSEMMNNSISEKLTDLDKSVSAAQENHQLNLQELRVKKAEIDSTYAKATRKVQDAENIMTKFGRLADSTFEAIRNARSAIFDSALSCLQDPISEMVKRILGETSKADTCEETPFPIISGNRSEVEWQGIAHDEIPTTSSCWPKTPSTKKKRGREEYIPLQRRPLKRACKTRMLRNETEDKSGNSLNDVKKKQSSRQNRSPEQASSTAESKSIYSVIETPKRNFCVTPCEKENNGFHLLLAETPAESFVMSKKGANQRTGMIRKKFGNTRLCERLNVIDDEFSFL